MRTSADTADARASASTAPRAHRQRCRVVIRRGVSYDEGLRMQEAAVARLTADAREKTADADADAETTGSSADAETADADAIHRDDDAEAALAGEPGTLFLVEHTPVVTLGRSGDGRHLRRSPEALAARGIDYRPVRRGGDVTWHGPGQWTLYPVLRLDRLGRDLHRYMRMLEEVAIRFSARHGLEATRRPGRTGAWVGRAKVAAVGVAVRQWISFHGMAVNVRPDLDAFRDAVVPCGIPEAEGTVSSVSALAGTAIDMDEAAEALAACFFEVFPLERID